MGKNGVTINDVAQQVGVSKVTVSYVLNGREAGIRISDATRQRVVRAARELGYHPNALARGLARRQTDTLAIVMQYPSVFSGWSGFINELMHGATDAASALGFDLMLHTKVQPDTERDVAALTDGRADGALLLRDKDDPMAGQLMARGFPCVQVFSRSPEAETCFVDCDNEAGAQIAVEHLYAQGHRRIGHLAGAPISGAAASRLFGYRQALLARGIDPRPEWECEVTYAKSDPEPFLHMMAGPQAPTALFTWSDDVAAWAIRLLRERLGLNVPRDVSVIGFDGTKVGEQTTPRLSSMRQPIYDMAAQGIELLTALVRSEPVKVRHVITEAKLIERDSCGQVPQDPGKEGKINHELQQEKSADGTFP